MWGLSIGYFQVETTEKRKKNENGWYDLDKPEKMCEGFSLSDENRAPPFSLENPGDAREIEKDRGRRSQWIWAQVGGKRLLSHGSMNTDRGCMNKRWTECIPILFNSYQLFLKVLEVQRVKWLKNFLFAHTERQVPEVSASKTRRTNFLNFSSSRLPWRWKRM